MLLAVDIGNTNIVVALFHENEIIHEWRLHSDPKRTADEYNSMILSFFRDNGISQSYIKSGVLSSVVPLLIGPFIRLMENIIGRKPIILGPSIYDKLPVTIPKSAIHEIGTDLVANSVQAFMEYKKPCIVADFGTALTFTAIDNKGNIQGVAIAPGIKTAVNSLFNNTAQLPSVPLEAPSSSLGRNTIHSIQSGIILGYKGLVESLISQIKNDLSKETDAKQEEIIVIATGGLNSVLKPITDVFEIVDKQLTLKGLKRIADLF
ncbi:MAG: type III pantothenate kinase [Treponemataceae bacterium]|jgi:type III pantothenate kinase|nr:type III pantothenate kinase [Treponemataceae bacterium]